MAIAGQQEDPEGSLGRRQERVRSTAAFPSLICSKWERLVRLLDVISQGPGCGGQEGLFFGFFNPKGDEYLDLGGVAQEQKPVGSFSSLSLCLAPEVKGKQRNPFLKGSMSVTW